MIRINDSKSKTTLKAALVSVFLLFAVVAGFGQQVVNLTAGPTTTTMPDGTTLPMWGYSCGAAGAPAVASTAATFTATTATDSTLALTPNAYVGFTVTAGAYTGVVVSNTATTLTVASWTTGTPPAAGTPTVATFSIATASCAPLTGSTSGAATGALGGIYVLNGGTSGYTNGATVTITPATGNTPTTSAAATVVTNSAGQIIGINVTNHGAGYTAAPTVAVTGGSGDAVLAAAPAWSPVELTVPYGQGLTINLTNNLSFGSAGNIPTSIVIIGQVGGGLGVQPVLNGTAGTPTTTSSPDHSNAQGCVSWFIAALPPGTPCTSSSGAVPPAQGARVQSMGAEVAAGAPGTATARSLTWPLLKPGTYLLESGTHPSIQVPMGLIGVLVVTTAPSGTTAGTAYPAFTATTAASQAAVPTAVTYNAEVPFEFSEIDPVQNRAVDQAVRNSQFSETRVWSGQAVSPDGVTPGCGNPSSSNYQSCYPPAVNYTPFYYLINGLAFDKANPAPSLFAATAGTATTGIPATAGSTVLVRLVNAGLRMHVPAIVGSQTIGYPGNGLSTSVQGSAQGLVQGFTLIAEDGNPLPNLGAPRVKTEVFMAAGKTYDVMLNVPTTTASLPIYDRELSLSANSSVRDAGMLAYIGVNGSVLPITPGTAGSPFATPVANPDNYAAVIPCTTAPCSPLVITDPSRGVIANDINVYGVALSTPPTAGTLSCSAVPGSPVGGICANGTFAYTPNAGSFTGDSFVYCANGSPAVTPSPTVSPSLCATVTLSASTLTGGPSAINLTYTAKTAVYIKIPSPGLLQFNSDPNRLPMTVVTSGAGAPTAPTGVTGATLVVDPQGGFTLSLPSPSTATSIVPVSFKYTVQNADGTQSAAAGTVTVNFPPPSNLQVNVLDAQAYNSCAGEPTCITALMGNKFLDYRWIIEEDKTFWVDPNCTTNASITATGCPTVVSTANPGASTIPSFGVNFHTSTADFVAQGCTGPLSCEGGQTMICGVTGAPACPAGHAAGSHIPAVCDLGNGACRPDPTGGNGSTPVNPSQVYLDPTKRYYISVLPGDAANPFPGNTSAPTCHGGIEAAAGDTTCGHAMSGAPIPPVCNVLVAGCTPASTTAFAPVNVLVLPTPLPTGNLTVIVFEDDFPLNGEQDGGGGNGTVPPIEPGLGGFNLVLWDTYGTLGDPTGQDSNDMFNMPLSNSLDGTVDPSTGLNACPITSDGTTNPTGITGMIVTCPKYESDGTTLSPLAGQAIIANLMPDKFSVQAYPGADRIARGEQWIQTNTLDGQHPHDAFIRIGEPKYFQEYGPAGYHVQIGFANPAIINARHTDVCNGNGTPGPAGPGGTGAGACTGTVMGQIGVERLSRTPDQRLYPSGSRDAFSWSQCWVSLGDPDGEDFQFTFCDEGGNFKFTNVPAGQWRLTIGDQWNDQIIDGLSTPANVTAGGTLNLGHIGAQQWQSNLYTKTCIDDNKNGICDPGEIGIPLIYTMIHFRDGHNANALTTDFNGVANFNETFPLFNWYVVEADSTRYKTTGIHTVYDAGGPADGSPSCGTSATSANRACGTAPSAYNFFTNTYEPIPLPADLSVPGAVYCTRADCATTTGANQFAAGTAVPSSLTNTSTGRIDPPWAWAEGFSGLTGQSNWVEFAKAPYAGCNTADPTGADSYCVQVTSAASGKTTMVGENGGIYGQVAYASTRPFDDASQMIQQPWEPNVPHVTVNLYQEGFAADGVTPTLTMVDTTQTTSWDDWAQGFYPNSTAGTGAGAGQKPYLNCPGQGTSTGTEADVFYYTLFDQPNYLDWYNSVHNSGTLHTIPYNSQYKCYDSMHIGNQLQPAPYDGKYFFPSSLGVNPTTGKLLAVKGSVNGVAASLNGTNCTVCVGNPDTTDKYRSGTPMLPPGKYVVEMIMPPGYEVYKEEDKNLLIGDNFIAPATVQFPGLGGSIFILPDQASVASMYDPTGAGYNPNNYQNSTTASGLNDELSGVPGFPGYTDPVWPCVGEMRVVPDYLSLFPLNLETAPFAGATRPLCDRKEVNLTNQVSANVRFFIFTSTHIAAKYTGVITDDFTSEFDPFSPQFGEKFAPPNEPVSTKDYLGNELSRVYSDHWGTYDGLTFSSWDVNPPNITGYSPAMMVQCMNDPGPILDTNPSSPTHGQMIVDPLYNPAYSNFCYTNPFMPGVTTYNDTPVVPTEANVGAGYNNVDCSYPDSTPAIKEVDATDDNSIGPWVSAAGKKITITGLGDQQVNNSTYSGPSANTAPFNLKTITRHYGFGTTQGTGSVTIGGQTAAIASWSDLQIVATVPSNVPNCAIEQQTQYGGSTAQCGQLVITAGNGQQSIDTVTVTIGGKAPTPVLPNQSIQAAIDAAAPGDMLMVQPTCTSTTTTGITTTPCTTAITSAAPGAVCTPSATATAACTTASAAAHNEMLIMWKPVRLQGVGAATSILDAGAFPAGKLLDPWRRHINCLFDLTLQGAPIGAAVPVPGSSPAKFTQALYDSTYTCPDTGTGPWNYFVGQGQQVSSDGTITTPSSPQIDRQPMEAVLGWDATQNGNLAEQLQEPSLMGAYEGAGITVLGKGVDFHGAYPWSDGNEAAAFPVGTTLLTGVGPNPAALPVGDLNPLCHTSLTVTTNPFPSNYTCNPSSIDGITVRDSSQGGGGIFVHGWAHYLQIANNRVYNNAGSLTGGISVGQGEFAPPYLQGSTTNSAPGSCSDGTGWITNQHLPYCLQNFVSVHNNMVTANSSLGDELFSGTLAGGGGATFCTGNDYYKFNYNWVCGNLSSGEGGGLVHLGEIQNGDIEHNTFALNQSQNPTIPTNGGGIQVQGTPDTDPVCGTQLDADCPPGLSDGTGHNLIINANLIQANMAESGSGGGIRLQQVNGTDVSTFPGNYPITAANQGRTVTITTTAPLPAVGDSVTIAGVSRAGYNGTFTVTGVGIGRFTYTPTVTGLLGGTGGTFTDTTVAGTAQTITAASETGTTVITITSSLSPTAGDSVTITGVTPAGYNGPSLTVTCTPASVVSAACPGGATAAGTFTYTGTSSLLAAGTGGAVSDSNPNQAITALWNSVSITNNIIVNNVAGWDGAGISLQDAMAVTIINNTIANNDSLASSGVLTQSIGTPLASAPAGNCTLAGGTASCPQSAGITSTPHSSLMTTSLTGLTLTCPYGEANGTVTGGGGGGGTGTSCAGFSNPLIANDLIYRNRSFRIGVAALGTVNLSQQHLISLFNMNGAAVGSQTSTGQCNANSADAYWEIGVRGDTGPTNHANAAFTLNPMYSLMTSTTGYAGTNATTAPPFVSAYCNGSRVPPECGVAGGCAGPAGFGVPPGIADALSPNPQFSLRPSATVDEGNNWINVSWGPMALSNESLPGGTYGNYGGAGPIGNYALTGAMDEIPTTEVLPPGITYPNTDFFGNPRPDSGAGIDGGAVEFPGTGAAAGATLTSMTPSGPFAAGTSVPVTFTGTNLTGTSSVNFVQVTGAAIGTTGGITVSALANVSATTVTATLNFPGTAAVQGTYNVTLTTSGFGITPLPNGASPFTVTAPTPTTTSITPNWGLRGTTVPVTIAGNNLNTATAVTMSGTGVTCTITGTSTVTTVTANCVISGTATQSARNVTVVTPYGSPVLTAAFTVAQPTVTSINPTSGLRGTVQAVTINGTYLNNATGVTMSGTGVTCAISGITGTTAATQVAANCTITATATLSTRNVTVANPGSAGNTVTLAAAFTVGINPVVSVAPTTLAFGNVGIGTTAPFQTLTLTNNSGVTFTGLTIAFTGTQYTMAAGGTPCGTTLAAAATCTIRVQFTAAAPAGPENGTVTITGSSAVSGSPVSLTGTAVVPVQTFTVTGGPLAFATNQLAGSTSASKTLTITNTGNVPFTGATYTFAGGPFARAAGGGGAAGTCGGTIAAGAACTYNVVFSPTTAGTYNGGTLTIGPATWTGTGNPVTLSGTSIAAAVTFGAMTPSLVTGTTTAHSGTITVTNPSASAITLAAAPTVTKVGGGGGTFTINAVTTTCASGLALPAGTGSCTIGVTFTPATGSTSTRTANVSITDTATGTTGTATQTSANFTAN